MNLVEWVSEMKKKLEIAREVVREREKRAKENMKKTTIRGQNTRSLRRCICFDKSTTTDWEVRDKDSDGGRDCTKVKKSLVITNGARKEARQFCETLH